MDCSVSRPAVRAKCRMTTRPSLLRSLRSSPPIAVRLAISTSSGSPWSQRMRSNDASANGISCQSPSTAFRSGPSPGQTDRIISSLASIARRLVLSAQGKSASSGVTPRINTSMQRPGIPAGNEVTHAAFSLCKSSWHGRSGEPSRAQVAANAAHGSMSRPWSFTASRLGFAIRNGISDSCRALLKASFCRGRIQREPRLWATKPL